MAGQKDPFAGFAPDAVATVELSDRQLRTMDRPRRLEMDYSLKNIPLHSRSTYRKWLIEKVESVARRMRWKAFFFLNGESNEDEKNGAHYGFKSKKTPPQIEELRGFEEDLTRMIENLQFRKITDPFQSKLKEDIKRMANTSDVIVRADKTKNIYQMPKKQYSKLLRENITKNYRLAPETATAQLNREAKEIAQALKLDQRIETMAEAEAYISLKDHKERFENDLPCRLINPAKSEIGMISKAILDRVVGAIKERTSVNLWENTSAVISWFDNIHRKEDCTFINFDVVDFYPSITESLLEQALDYAASLVDISDNERMIIMHARKSLLFQDGRPWIKKHNKGWFDVTMGSFDGAEICQLVGAYLLNKLSQHIEENAIGLYRDDGLGIVQNMPGRTADKLRKTIVKVFKSAGLRVTIDVNLKIVSFLDVTFDLSTGRYQAYRKPGDRPLFLNKRSNHPPIIIKNLPNTIAQRVSSISANEEAFNQVAQTYNTALMESGFTQKISYKKVDHQVKRKRRQRKRNIIWFNPPYSQDVATNIGAIFLRLVTKHFPKTSKLAKIFNRRTIKVSYCCLPNVASIIASQNRRKLAAPESSSRDTCNCRVPTNCPLDGKCQAQGIVYEATVTAHGDSRTYIGISEPPFKFRYANHKTSFTYEKYRNSTELSKHIWELKEKGEDYALEWRIKERARTYSSISKRCGLCTAEKDSIITADKEKTLNKRSEMISKCKHAAKFSLANFIGVT